MSNNEVALPERSEMSVFPPARAVMSTARQVLMEHAELSDMAWQFANKLVTRKMTPTRWRNQPEEATAAILYGAEIGLPPIAALQNIFEVHGSPGIYARTAQALLEGKGFQFKTMEQTSDTATVCGWKPGRDPYHDAPDETSTFTIEDATRAGWAPKLHDGDKGGVVIDGVRYQSNQYGKLAGNEKYLTQPRQMLWAKAMMEVCRHLSPATLLGIAYSVEELESEAPATEQGQSQLGATGAAGVADTLTVEEILNAGVAKSSPVITNIANSTVPNVAAPPKDVMDSGHNTVMDQVIKAVPDDQATDADDTAPPAPTPAPDTAKDTKPKRAPKGGKPKGMTPRVEAALAKAQAAAAAPKPADQDDDTNQVVDPPAATAAVPPLDATKIIDGDLGGSMPLDEPTPDPSDPEPTGDALDMGDDPDGDMDEQADIAAAQPVPPVVDDAAISDPDPEPTRDYRPATKEQLQELTKCIAAAGFQPTPDGRETWFAWLSQEVDRAITANNQLQRWEIDQVIATMSADQ